MPQCRSGADGCSRFHTPDARRLAALFAIVYFAQGMWYLPNQTITVSFKDAGYTASAVADFFLISTLPWIIKPVYGLISDFIPLFGRRRKSYFVVTTSLAAAAGAWLALLPRASVLVDGRCSSPRWASAWRSPTCSPTR